MDTGPATSDVRITHEAVDFATALRFGDIPPDAVHLARRCVLDGLAVMLAGSEQPALEVMERYIDKVGGMPDSRLLGFAARRVPAHLAALWHGLAGHAMDWDDTQLAENEGRAYGLLTHPSIPPLAACLAISDMVGGVDGERFLTAFVAGFEVECKIAEAINPDHYMKGFHSSGTMGTFGSAIAAAKLLGLEASAMACAVGIAASMASGIRVNFGTMTKPLHVGRSSENGVTAALLAGEGFTANEEALDGEWGFFSVAGRGGNPELVAGRFGAPLSIASPGVSIKPYPCGVLTHPTMDAMLKLMRDNALKPDDIERVTLYAGSNILGPIRFEIANSELEGKFCMAFLLAAIIVAGKAGKAEFTDAFVLSDVVQDMQRRVSTSFDAEIEAQGWDRIRSRVEAWTRDGRHLVQEADENYRGGPHNPMSDAEVEGKFRDCAVGLLDEAAIGRVFEAVWGLESLADAGELLTLLDWRGDGAEELG
jgi:2-methylcitrate dehydratase PrpD